MTARTAPSGGHLAEALARIHEEAFPDTPWSAEALTDLVAKPGARLEIARAEDGTPCGFALARQVLDEAELLTIAVLPNCRGRGVGRSLLKRLVTRLATEGAVCLFLEVAEDNAPARALYTAVGLVEIGRRKGYYRVGRKRPVDAILMTLALTDGTDRG